MSSGHIWEVAYPCPVGGGFLTISNSCSEINGNGAVKWSVLSSVTPPLFKSEDVETQQSAKWKNRSNLGFEI